MISSFKSDLIGLLVKSISCRVSCSSFLLEESCSSILSFATDFIIHETPNLKLSKF